MRINPAGAIAAVFLCAAISTSAQAAEPAKAGGFRLYGAGTESCGTWLANRENPILNNGEVQWILGFVSASNVLAWAAGKHPRDTDANAIKAWVDKYCREHPLEDLSGASMVLVTELAKPE